jgi:RNA polymerase sigma-70 factor (ECF subfamily)
MAAVPKLVQPTETTLVAGARAGDEGAIRELIRRNNHRLFRVARAVLRDDGEAEDVVQAAYVRAFTALTQFRGEAAFSTWLTRIALNEALGRRRQRKHKVEVEMLDEVRPSGEIIAFPHSLAPQSPESETGRAEMRALLEECIDALPEIFRLVLVLRDIEELSTEETADYLGLKPETVKTRLFRARKQVREMLAAKLSPVFSEVFPFDGQRCVDMAGRVVAVLRAEGLVGPAEN